MRFPEIFHFFGEEKASGGAGAVLVLLPKSRHMYAPSIATANASTAANTSQNCLPPLVVVVVLLLQPIEYTSTCHWPFSLRLLM